MALIVEDGTGVAGAESYTDRSTLEQVCLNYGLPPLGTVTEAQVDAALRRGTLAFEAIYAPRFPGRAYSAEQGLRFPMHDLTDPRGYVLPGLPDKIVTATAVLARHELSNPMSLFPTVTPGKTKKFVKADKIEVEYELTGGSLGAIAGARPVLSLVEGILAGIVLLPPVGGRTLYGSSVRG